MILSLFDSIEERGGGVTKGSRDRGLAEPFLFSRGLSLFLKKTDQKKIKSGSCNRVSLVSRSFSYSRLSRNFFEKLSRNGRLLETAHMWHMSDPRLHTLSAGLLDSPPPLTSDLRHSQLKVSSSVQRHPLQGPGAGAGELARVRSFSSLPRPSSSLGKRLAPRAAGAYAPLSFPWSHRASRDRDATPHPPPSTRRRPIGRSAPGTDRSEGQTATTLQKEHRPRDKRTPPGRHCSRRHSHLLPPSTSTPASNRALRGMHRFRRGLRLHLSSRSYWGEPEARAGSGRPAGA